eukprot:3160268-Alexandrium_andersonii.AAC.1
MCLWARRGLEACAREASKARPGSAIYYVDEHAELWGKVAALMQTRACFQRATKHPDCVPKGNFCRGRSSRLQQAGG